ncbi:MAG: ribonuclease [Haloplasmataceae bacterium]|nr:ribonuclease [Haloplasmataceae bacterium]
MKNQILELINNPNYERMTLNEIAALINVVEAEAFKELVKTFVSLEDDYILYRDKNDRYDLLERFGFKKGVLQVHKKGFGFVTLVDDDSKDVFIPKTAMNGAMNKDVVLLTISKRKSGNNLEGEIIKVIERGMTSTIGVYQEDKNVGYVTSDDNRFTSKIIINKNNSKGAMPDHKVKVEIIKFLENNIVEGKIVEILGHKNDPGIDILSVVYKHGLSTIFSEMALEQAEHIKDEVTEEDFKGRRDLRDQLIVTIDGEDAKDLDDAVTVTKLENGNYKLGVHIADVSYYVRENDWIDKEAFKRGTSVYLVDRVIPMIPHRLSNGICSLNPNVNRLVISCEMEINQIGDVVKYEIFPGVIKTVERMTYTNVNNILVHHDKEVMKRYEYLLPMFNAMNELFDILNKRRKKRGAINFETNEARIIVDEFGKPYDVKLRTRDVAEKIIEEFMLAANETIAENFHWLNYPFIYRVHESPKEEKLKRFFQLLNALGYVVKGRENTVHPKAFQEILEKVENQKEAAVINTMLVRSMAKAKYSEQSLGHYGLATKFYTHFTSPIRRYPDTIVHRLIRELLFETKTDENNLERWTVLIKDIALQTSKCERTAVDCERDVDDMKKAEYMQDKIGQEFEGIISSVTNWGIYVELPNTIEGLVHVLDMTDDYYDFDEKTMSLIGERTKKIYRIGDEVKVKVSAANKEEGEIDFEIVGVNPRQRPKIIISEETDPDHKGKKPYNKDKKPYNKDKKHNNPKQRRNK